LVELLGRGGMGEVWRAFDTQTGHVVALKALPPQFADDEMFKQRFWREPAAAAGLNEPHVAPIFDVGEIDRRPYVSTELIDGRDAQTLLTGGPMAPTAAHMRPGAPAEQHFPGAAHMPAGWNSPVWPPESKRSRRGLAIALTGAAVIVIVAVVAAVLLINRGDKASSVPTVASSSARATTAAPPSIDTLLLGADEVDQIMGTSDMLSDGVVTELFESAGTTYSPNECRGVLTSGAPMQFSRSGYTAIREQNVRNASINVGQDVLQYASSDAATKVVDSLAASWESCRGKPVTETTVSTGTQGVLTLQEVATDQHKLFALHDIARSGPKL
jgi:hypothetical protein